jgi:hypothetical protein
MTTTAIPKPLRRDILSPRMKKEVMGIKAGADREKMRIFSYNGVADTR